MKQMPSHRSRRTATRVAIAWLLLFAFGSGMYFTQATSHGVDVECVDFDTSESEDREPSENKDELDKILFHIASNGHASNDLAKALAWRRITLYSSIDLSIASPPPEQA